MALVESSDIGIGSVMPSFSLEDAMGDRITLADSRGEMGTLIIFTCNHCPYALAVWPRLIRLGLELSRDGIGTVAINPNIHPDYPDDSPSEMAKRVTDWGIPFPYLIDATQEVARSYDAQCTPDIYLLDAQDQLVYHGRIDDNWKNESLVTHRDLWEAAQGLINGFPPLTVQKPSMGCSIKWRSNFTNA
ncbi:thioredoxin family protein [bacterium]|nr:thioredoxin family protein [bacterium]